MYDALGYSYKKTLDTIKDNAGIQAFFDESNLEKMRHLDAVIAIYFRGRHEATDGEDWREEARQWLVTQGSAEEDIETYVEAVERYADFLVVQEENNDWTVEA